MSPDRAKAQQYAALPFRRKRGGAVEVMLVTSRETRRWIIPKGWPIKGVAPGNLAALEAMEEAGLIGRISDEPVGNYSYDKKRSDGSIVTCDVATFTLEVEQQMPTWPEKKQRETKWFGVDDAAKAVQEPELRDIIKKLRALIK